MSRIAYVNGRYVPHRDAAIHIEDRGYQFADGVYEVIAVEDGVMIDDDLHYRRLGRSLDELAIARPMSDKALDNVLREVIRRNRVRNGIVYLQVTRGVARRDHAFPAGDVEPAVVVTARRLKPADPAVLRDGVRVITVPDIRWKRRDIKSVSLLPNVLAKEKAKASGAYEAWQIDEDGLITEGTATNAWIINDRDELITRPAGPEILNGCTRQALIEMATAAGLELVERPFTLLEALAAKEAFLSSTTNFVCPIVKIDDAQIGDGSPGPYARKLRSLYLDHIDSQKGAA